MKRSHTVAADAAWPEMAVIQGNDPEQLVRTAIEELGGIHRFVSRADIVLVKPNIGWDRTSRTGGQHQSEDSLRDRPAVLERRSEEGHRDGRER